jgi:hypothetical protein
LAGRGWGAERLLRSASFACIGSMADVEHKQKYKLPSGALFTGKIVIAVREEDGSLVDENDVDKPIAGVMRYVNGDVFSGTFLDCQRHGTGKYTFANGDIFDGVFICGDVCGKGLRADDRPWKPPHDPGHTPEPVRGRLAVRREVHRHLDRRRVYRQVWPPA